MPLQQCLGLTPSNISHGLKKKKILHAIFPTAHPLPTLPEQGWNAGWDTDSPSQAGERCVAFRDKPMEKAKINFDWPLDLLRSETVKVYVNNEINILVLFWAKWGSILIQMCFGLKNSFVNLGMSFLFFYTTFAILSFFSCYSENILELSD